MTITTAPASVQRNEFHTTDLSIAQHFLGETYGAQLRLTGSTEWRVIRHSRLDTSGFSLHLTTLPGRLQMDCQPQHRVMVSDLDAGRLRAFSRDHDDNVGIHEPLIPSQPHLEYRLQLHHTRMRLITIDPTLVRRVAGGDVPLRKLPDQLQFSAFQPPTIAHRNLWIRTVDHVAAVIHSEQATTLIVDTAAQMLTAVMLQCFPNNLNADPHYADRSDTTPRLLRRAIAFIENNAHTDICLTDIAAATCVSPRAVQYMFRRHLDITPIAYLRRVRLERAHHALLAASPQETTVTAIAAQWGFAHIGRFAAAYRETFGQSPHRTLRE